MAFSIFVLVNSAALCAKVLHSTNKLCSVSQFPVLLIFYLYIQQNNVNRKHFYTTQNMTYEVELVVGGLNYNSCGDPGI